MCGRRKPPIRRALQRRRGRRRDESLPTWYGLSSFTVDVNLTDGNPASPGAWYNLDWDSHRAGHQRRETSWMRAAAAWLDSRSAHQFQRRPVLGLETLSGHVTIRIHHDCRIQQRC